MLSFRLREICAMALGSLKMRLLALAGSIAPLTINRIAIERVINSCRTRPHPLSMSHDYVTWTGLSDSRWSARHLPPRKDLPANQANPTPVVDEIVPIFARRNGQVRFCDKSTCLFPAFAQYLTDGFIRTKMPSDTADRLNPIRKQNTSNNQIDMCPLYGRTPEQTYALRHFSEKSGQRGRLSSQRLRTAAGEEEFPPFLYDDSGQIRREFEVLDPPLGLSSVPDEMKRTIFAIGGDRANAVPSVTLMNTLFLREHNRLAGEIERVYPEWDDERVFQTARNTIIVLFIKMVVEEYINHINPRPIEFKADPTFAWKAPWNKPNWITTEFSLLYRWHSLVPEIMTFGGKPYPVHMTFMNNRIVIDTGLAQGFIDLSAMKAARLGVFNTSDSILPRERFAIEQGRLCELASYADYREYCSLTRPQSFEEISTDPQVASFLKDRYIRPENVEFYTGLFAEDHVKNSPLPQLILSMVGVDAFSQAFTNPLLSEHVFNEATFSKVGWAAIHETNSIRQLVERNVPTSLGDARIAMTQADWSFAW
jgi:prostaglandin-endoperoxide synthase 2